MLLKFGMGEFFLFFPKSLSSLTRPILAMFHTYVSGQEPVEYICSTSLKGIAV